MSAKTKAYVVSAVSTTIYIKVPTKIQILEKLQLDLLRLTSSLKQNVLTKESLKFLLFNTSSSLSNSSCVFIGRDGIPLGRQSSCISPSK